MKLKVSQVFLICSFFIHLQLSATTYYISNKGDDTSNGISPENAWKTALPLKNIPLKPGDSILFKSGEKFNTSLQVKRSGKPELPVVISIYGGKTKAEISGSKTISSWKHHDGNTYFAECEQEVKFLFMNNEIQQLARYPDTGFFYTDEDAKHTGKIQDKSIGELKDGYLTGSLLKHRPVNWSFETREIYNHVGNTIVFDSSLLENRRASYRSKEGMEFYFVNKFDFLNAEKEWIYKENKLYYVLPENSVPDNLSVEAVIEEHGVKVEKNIHDIIIENLHLTRFNRAGIKIGENSSNIIIRNCNFTNIVVMAVELDLQVKNTTIENNYIEDIYGRGISAIEPWDIKILRNKIRRIGLLEGYGFNGVNNAIGILIQNIENYDHGLARRNEISYNTIDSVGYCGLRMDGTKSTAKRNIIKHYMLVMNDGGAMYSWGGPFKYAFDNIFEENIIIQGEQKSMKKVRNTNLKNAIYMDGGTHNIKVKNNIVVNGYFGLHSNWCTHINQFTGNILYNPEGYGISSNSNSYECDGENYMMHAFTNNMIVSRSKNSQFIRAAEIGDTSVTIFSEINNNIYIDDTSKIFASFQHFIPDEVDTFMQYKYKDWKKKHFYDSGSTFIDLIKNENPGSKDGFVDVILLVNTSEKPRFIKLEKKLYHVPGLKKASEVTIKAFSGEVLLMKNRITTEKINKLKESGVLVFH